MAAGVGAASLRAAAAGAGARSCPGGVRLVGMPKAGLPAGGGGREVGVVAAAAVAVGVLPREPALQQVGDLSLERTENPRWGGKGGYQVPDLGGLASASPPYACALGPRLPPRIHLSHATTPNLPLPSLPADVPRLPFLTLVPPRPPHPA